MWDPGNKAEIIIAEGRDASMRSVSAGNFCELYWGREEKSVSTGKTNKQASSHIVQHIRDPEWQIFTL